ncbi:MAG: hypothetical protein WD073_09740 [Xanthobacteraceae bacterium]
MDDKVARHVVRAVFRSGSELERLLGLLKEHCSPDEYKTYARAIASAIDGINSELLNRVLSSHPQLAGEIEADIAKFGRFL